MKPITLAAVALWLACLPQARAVELQNLKVLYLGDAPDGARAKQVTGFLENKVREVKALTRGGFKQEQAAPYDVVILDWPQSGTSDQERKQGSPLGPRATWSKPTVLLGSAGL